MDACLPAITVTCGQAIFFDGVCPVRRAATVALGLTAMEIRDPDGEALAAWRYGDLATYSAPDGMLRVGAATNAARLEIRDRDLAAAFTARAGRIRQRGALAPRTRLKVVGWNLAGVASALLVAMFGLPTMVERIAPLVPLGVEQRLGAGVDSQFRAQLARARLDECGQDPNAQASRAAFDKMVSQLEDAAALPLPVRAAVVRHTQTNAVALPGGHVYVFADYVKKARTQDELAAAIAHEMGHVAHRDGMREVIQPVGLWFLFGPLIGDFGAGAAAWVTIHTVLLPTYAREREAAADAFGAQLMLKLGRNPRADGDFMLRYAGAAKSKIEILLTDHPETRERVAAIEAIARAAPKRNGSAAPELLTAAEWAALKQICQAAPASTPTATPEVRRQPSRPATTSSAS
jgi:Zn-dependent protease with chaperone function